MMIWTQNTRLLIRSRSTGKIIVDGRLRYLEHPVWSRLRWFFLSDEPRLNGDRPTTPVRDFRYSWVLPDDESDRLQYIFDSVPGTRDAYICNPLCPKEELWL